MKTTEPIAPALDWDALHERIRRAQEGTQALLSPDAATEAQTLAERARRLAAPATTLSHETGTDLVLFTVGDDRYAVPTSAVRHVFTSGEPVPIPWAPSLFLGLVNHRGRPLPVVDVAALLGRASTVARGGLPLVLVLGDEPDELGCAVSSAGHIGRVADGEIQRDAIPEGLADVGFVRGITADRVLVLDVVGLLADPRLVIGLPT